MFSPERDIFRSRPFASLFPLRPLKRRGRLESVNGVGGEGRQRVRAPDPVAGKPVGELREKDEAENDQHDA